MSTRALRKLQGGRKDLTLPNSCSGDDEEEEEEEDKDEQHVKETLLLPAKGPNRFDLVSRLLLCNDYKIKGVLSIRPIHTKAVFYYFLLHFNT